MLSIYIYRPIGYRYFLCFYETTVSLVCPVSLASACLLSCCMISIMEQIKIDSCILETILRNEVYTGHEFDILTRASAVCKTHNHKINTIRDPSTG